MNGFRIVFLRLMMAAALIAGGSLLYDAYDDLTWGRRAIAEAGARAWRPGYTQDSIIADSAQKKITGGIAEGTGLLLIAAAFLMEGLAALLSAQRRAPVTPDQQTAASTSTGDF